MSRIVWRVRLVVVDRSELWREWQTAGDQPDLLDNNGGVLCRGVRATPEEREAAREDAKDRLETLRESRRSVLSELNSKAQTYGTIQAGTTALFGFGMITLLTIAPQIVLGVVCLGIGILLSVIAMGMLRWMAVAGNSSMWTRRNENVGVRALRESRFDQYVRLTQNCHDMLYVVQKRRRLFVLIAIVAIGADAVAFGWVLAEAIVYLT